MIVYGTIKDFDLLIKEFGTECKWGNVIWRIESSEKKLLALINFHSYNGRDIEIDLLAFHPRWLTKGLINTFFRYCFETLCCERISASTSKENKRSRKLIEGLGFLYEGNRKKARFNGTDQIDYGMLRKDCKWIRSKK